MSQKNLLQSSWVMEIYAGIKLQGKMGHSLAFQRLLLLFIILFYTFIFPKMH